MGRGQKGPRKGGLLQPGCAVGQKRKERTQSCVLLWLFIVQTSFCETVPNGGTMLAVKDPHDQDHALHVLL